ncbi:glycosyltransferase family 2 protein [Confluentibacter lentus]|uniref:glycosyltransferase family 2 protein n=1 Tax=Confluentibacter lentus TaxID=1699412 RepID=UPI000C28FDC4|nr:glycosyltransferase family 2 protein [Confluentibacter lentus]
MNRPLISIIIPVYNRAHLIDGTLNSIKAQTYQNWECIIVDDGSTDNLKYLINKYIIEDSRFQYIHRPKNKPKGANSCRNYGLYLSKGDYINWFDSDDLMVHNKLEIQINHLHNSSYDYSICQTMMVDLKSKEKLGLRAPKLISDNIFEDYVSYNIFWLTGAPLWKKSFLNKNNLVFDENLYQAQDYDFHMKTLLISENYLQINEPLVIFNFHEDNMSNSRINNTRKIASNIKVLNMIINKYNFRLSKSTLKKKYAELLKLYKFCLINSKFKSSLMVLKSLYQNINILEISNYAKFVFIMKSCMAFLSFLIFSKGERFLRFNIL